MQDFVNCRNHCFRILPWNVMTTVLNDDLFTGPGQARQLRCFARTSSHSHIRNGEIPGDAAGGFSDAADGSQLGASLPKAL